ncbi:MAG TPA: hypothetical protein DCM26_02095 [Desulfotomaculum sp.]|jgi:hypothetical protein|nr:hypothetical protein [Desulfotomaculum sp.]
MPTSLLDPENFPEPIRNLLQNFDPAALGQLAALIDPDTLTGFLNNTLGTLRQSLKPEDAEAFDQILASLIRTMKKQSR